MGAILSIAFFVLVSLAVANHFFGGRTVRWGELASPSGTYILTVSHVYPGMMWGGNGPSYFHLTYNGFLAKRVPSLAYLLGKDVLVTDGFDLPYGIVWRNDHHVVIKLDHPIEKEFEYEGRHVKMYRSKVTKWGGVKISFGLIGTAPEANELRITTPIGLELPTGTRPR